ncbi:hypothetical protein BH23CHL2_BH23CHL2_18970 [soil metagenome]
MPAGKWDVPIVGGMERRRDLSDPTMFPALVMQAAPGHRYMNMAGPPTPVPSSRA